MEPQVYVDPQDAEQNKVMGILAYIIFLIPLLAARESKFAMYHTNQGLVLFLGAVALGIAYTLLSTILFAIVGWRGALAVGGFLSLLSTIIYLGIGVFAVLGIVNAAKGECKPLPLIGRFNIIK